MKANRSKLFLFLLLSCFLISCGDDDDDNNDTQNNDIEEPDNGPTDQTTADQFVAAHNALRSEVGVADIEWSEALAESAQEWADQLAEECALIHSTSGFGENLWGGTSGFFSVQDVVDSWGEEKDFYDVEANQCVGGDCLHYTQIVWENTTEVGCGMITCDGIDIWVCQYNPAGNIIGERPF